MIKIETAGLGVVEIDENKIINFRQGVPGFETVRKYAWITIDDLPFSYLQSVENETPSFVVADPFSFFPKYEFDLPDSDLEELQVESPEHLSVFGIITMRDHVNAATMNLVAPVVINAEKRLGKQIILTNCPYTTKHRLFQDSND